MHTKVGRLCYNSMQQKKCEKKPIDFQSEKVVRSVQSSNELQHTLLT